MQFKTRQRGVSRRLSAQVKQDGEFGALINEDGELHEAFSHSQRVSKMKYYGAWGVVNVLLGVYVLTLIIFFWDAWKVPCVETISYWLCVYELL